MKEVFFQGKDKKFFQFTSDCEFLFLDTHPPLSLSCNEQAVKCPLYYECSNGAHIMMSAKGSIS